MRQLDLALLCVDLSGEIFRGGAAFGRERTSRSMRLMMPMLMKVLVLDGEG